MATQFLNPPGLCPTFGWTHVVTATGGRTVYISGQVSVDERGEVVGKGDLKTQTQQTFESLKAALAAAGATVTVHRTSGSAQIAHRYWPKMAPRRPKRLLVRGEMSVSGRFCVEFQNQVNGYGSLRP